MNSEDVTSIENAIATLRTTGSPDDRRKADHLQERLEVMKARHARLDHLTLEGVTAWVNELRDMCIARKVSFNDLDKWPPSYADEACQVLTTALAVTMFRKSDAAKSLGVTRPVLDAWLASAAFNYYRNDPLRIEDQLRTVGALALQRAAYILSLDTNQQQVLTTQAGLIKSLMGARPPSPPPPPKTPLPRTRRVAAPAPQPVVVLGGDKADG